MGGFDEFLFDEKVFNKEPGDTPTVTTQVVTDILKTTATGNGTITDTGVENAHTRGICYMQGTTGDPTIADSKVFDNGAGSYGVGTYSKAITGLTQGTSYRARAYATNSAGIGYGTTVGFYTIFEKLVSDSGAGADVASILAKIPISDSGVGADVIGIVDKRTILDSGAGIDLISILAKIQITDAGIGTDIASIVVKVPISDIGSAIEKILVICGIWKPQYRKFDPFEG